MKAGGIREKAPSLIPLHPNSLVFFVPCFVAWGTVVSKENNEQREKEGSILLDFVHPKFLFFPIVVSISRPNWDTGKVKVSLLAGIDCTFHLAHIIEAYSLLLSSISFQSGQVSGHLRKLNRHQGKKIGA